MKRWIIVLSLVVSATGCVDVEIKTRFKRNGSGVQTWNLTSGALVAREIKKQIEADPILGKAKRLIDQFNNGEYTTGLEMEFQNVSDLGDDGRKLEFSKTGWLRQTCIYRETWDESKGRIASLMKNAGGFVPLTIKVAVEMPGRITKTNAPQVKEQTAIWSFSLAEMPGSRTMVVESVHWNVAAILMLSAIGAAFVVAGATIMIRRTRRTPAVVQTCSSCGAAVPGGFFCNNCGAKLGSS